MIELVLARFSKKVGRIFKATTLWVNQSKKLGKPTKNL